MGGRLEGPYVGVSLHAALSIDESRFHKKLFELCSLSDMTLEIIEVVVSQPFLRYWLFLPFLPSLLLSIKYRKQERLTD